LNSEPTPKRTYTLSVEITQRNGGPSVESRVTVLDAWDRIVSAGKGEAEEELPTGLYTVRIERAGELAEYVVRHVDGTHKQFEEPLRLSAVPSFDTVTTHEYFAYTSQNWSMNNTCSPLGTGSPDGRLFVFLRTLSSDHDKGADLAAGLSLLDLAGNLLSDFGPDKTQRSSDGWLALSAPAAPGLYILHYEGKEPREMPLWVYGGWSTQVFAVYRGRLRLATASMLLPHIGEPFNPDNRQTQALDAALRGLQQGRNLLPRGMMSVLLSGKFDNPMLGLVGAHLLFMRDQDPDPNSADIILGNLEDMLGPCPDVRALRLLAARAFQATPTPEPFFEPPMLRAGLDAVLREAAMYPELVPEEGLVDHLSTRQFVDTPWTSWEPLITTPPGDEKTDWVTGYLEEALERDRLLQREPDVQQLARSVGLSTHTVERRLKDQMAQSAWIRREGDDFQKIQGIGRTFETLLKTMGHQTYEDLAELETGDLDRIRRRLGRFAPRIEKDGWIEQARQLSEQK